MVGLKRGCRLRSANQGLTTLSVEPVLRSSQERDLSTPEPDLVPPDLLRRLEAPPLSTLIQLYADTEASPTAEKLRQQHQDLLLDFNDAELSAGISTVLGGGGGDGAEDEPALGENEGDLRRPEFAVLRQDLDHPDLMVRRAEMTEYAPGYLITSLGSRSSTSCVRRAPSPVQPHLPRKRLETC